MILVDTNLLLYAVVADLPQHSRASAWLEQVLNADARVGLPWPSLLGFLRIVTSARAFARPLSVTQAWRQVEEWLSLPAVWIPLPTNRHAEVVGRLLIEGRASGNLVPDAHLAALAIEHGLEVSSSDSDFARFEGLRWRNPLAQPAK